MGYILEAAHRRSHSDVVTMIKAARQGILGLLPSIAGEGGINYSCVCCTLLARHLTSSLQQHNHRPGVHAQPCMIEGRYNIRTMLCV